ncbi:MAG: hypothetical protein M1541_07770 [Acidobacteria bacterium]|nr:hypothetical protein [Acidobacteriota bacterium]
MKLSDVFLALGEERTRRLLGCVSIGKLRTYQLFDRMKARLYLHKLNAETMVKAAPRAWTRLGEGDEEFARDLAQAVLVSQLGMVRAVLDFLGVPHEDGFFAKDLDAAAYLTDNWQERVWEKFHESYPESALLLYINHLAWELTKEPELFIPKA